MTDKIIEISTTVKNPRDESLKIKFIVRKIEVPTLPTTVEISGYIKLGYSKSFVKFPIDGSYFRSNSKKALDEINHIIRVIYKQGLWHSTWGIQRIWILLNRIEIEELPKVPTFRMSLQRSRSFPPAAHEDTIQYIFVPLDLRESTNDSFSFIDTIINRE